MTEIHRVSAEIPPYSPKGKVLTGDKQALMWEIAEERNCILGKLGKVGSLVWYGLYPEGNNVKESSAGVHLMITPKKTEDGKILPVSFQNISVGELALGMRFCEEFLKHCREKEADSNGIAIAGWNVSSEATGRRSQSQTWHNLHLHGIVYPYDEMERLKSMPIGLREFGSASHLTDRVMKKYLQDHPIKGIKYLSEENKYQIFPYSVIGGTLLLQAKELSSQMVIDLDKWYHDLHEAVFTKFVANYQEVKESNWTRPYVLKIPEIQSDFPFDIDNGRLLKMFKRLQPEEEIAKSNKDHLVLRGPVYSVNVVLNRDETFTFVLRVNLFRSTGFPQALGLDIKRTVVESAPFGERRRMSQSVFDEIKERINE